MADANVTWSPLPSANDTVEGPIDPSNITCEDVAGNVVMSGDRFAVGTTTVTCRANDSIPHEGFCQFSITVVGMYIFLHCKKCILHVCIKRIGKCWQYRFY